jgi:tRNA threonylcarbamoyladenosine biosynthesis protein TsaE
MSQSAPLELRSADAAATRELGARLARALDRSQRGPLVIGLKGELGTGKTTFVRGFLGALGVTTTVRSPTYTLLEEYELGTLRVAHLDLYRLQGREQIEELGIRELLDRTHLLLVEWPERGAGALPANDVTVELAYADAGRIVGVSGESAAGRAWVAEFSRNSGTRSG